MAQATHNTIEREVTETVTVTEGVVLTLTEDETYFLRDVLGKIGGDPGRSRRRLANAISEALDDLGYERVYGGAEDADGGILFATGIGRDGARHG